MNPIMAARRRPKALEVEYLIVAGGGYRGNQYSWAGGGGAGGMVGGEPTDTFQCSLGTTYPVVVGAAGFSGSHADQKGDDSSCFGLTAVGGGSFAQGNGWGGDSGGSGQGGAGSPATGGGAGTAGQGNEGGDSNSTYGAGGGGAGSAGQDASSGSAGGSAKSSSITGSAVDYCGGGPGRGTTTNGTGAYGQGGGTSPGNGVVIIRYLGSQVATGGTVTTSGGYTIHTFTSSGNFIT